MSMEKRFREAKPVRSLQEEDFNAKPFSLEPWILDLIKNGEAKIVHEKVEGGEALYKVVRNSNEEVLCFTYPETLRRIYEKYRIGPV